MANSTKKDAKRASDALQSASGNTVAKKNSKTEYTKGHEELVDRAVRRKFVAEQAANIYDQTNAQVVAVAGEIYEQRARDGQFEKSVNLAGEEYEGLNVAFSDKFSSIPVESKQDIIDTYVASGMSEEEAQKAFEENFRENRVVTLADTSNETIAALDLLLKFGQLLTADEADIDDIAENFLEKFRRELRGRLARGGQIEFGEIFSSKIELVTNAGMDERQFDQPEGVRGLLKQSKGATKIKVKVATAAATEASLKDVCEVIMKVTKEAAAED